jgi:hypothetical protein
LRYRAERFSITFLTGIFQLSSLRFTVAIAVLCRPGGAQC